MRIAICGMAMGALSACSSAAQVPAKAAAPAPLPTVTVAANAAPTEPLTPVIAPETLPEMGAFARRLAATIDGARPQVTPVAIDLSALPRATIKAPIDAKTATKLDVSKFTEDPNLIAKPMDGYSRQYMINFSFKDPAKMTFGHVRITGTYGLNEGWFGGSHGNVMNVYQGCGRAGAPIPIQWETVLFEKGVLKYTVSDGILDRLTCRVLRVESSTVTAKPMIPSGLLYGFRSCEASCEEKEELTVLFPRASNAAAGALGGGADRSIGSFSMVTFPIQRGGGGAFMARIAKRDATDWLRLANDAQKSADAKPSNVTASPLTTDANRLAAIYLTSFEIGVEVSQARDENTPLAVAYTDSDLATLLPILAEPLPIPTAAAASILTSTPNGLDDRN